MADVLNPIRQRILDFITAHHREYGFPPTIREIGAAVDLKSPATVKGHVDILIEHGYIRKDTSRSRTMTVTSETEAMSSAVRRVPLIGSVAAGTGVLAQEESSEVMTLPEQFAGRGETFILQVRGESMIEAAILPGDYVVVQAQTSANKGEIVVAGIPGEEATVKRFFPQGNRIILQPENSDFAPMEYDASEVVIYGKVISVLRSY